ncbi:hypothetical protein GOP47_0029816 [Adiantum capillus-veneris]|nr:hypothetical protein GOP47_0029816 [Adiantum capillus-veneris]
MKSVERREPVGGQLQLPPGFRFYPSDEELVVHYLCKRASSQPFTVPIIAEIDLYKFDPWELPGKALFGEKEWYFFSPRDRKYPNGSRPNRAAGSGYWKATGTDKPINMHNGNKVGVKKALVFYKGRPPKGDKTNWIMHEYRLADSAAKAAKRKGSIRLDDWVLCRIYKKIPSATRLAMQKEEGASEEAIDFGEGQEDPIEMEEDSKLGIRFSTSPWIENNQSLTSSTSHTFFNNYTPSQNQSHHGSHFQVGSNLLDSNASSKPFIKPPHMYECTYRHSGFGCKEPSMYTPIVASDQSSITSGMYTNASINSNQSYTTSTMQKPNALSSDVLTRNLITRVHPLLTVPHFSTGTNDSPGNSSVDDERGLPIEVLHESQSNTNQGGEPMPLFNFDALPSPFGRLDQSFSF